jgi:hypothetical protein
MEIIHGAWSLGVNATDAELEEANAVMREMARIGAHSADVVARWMHTLGMHGVKGDPRECVLVRWLRQATGVGLLRVGRYHVTGYRQSEGQYWPVQVEVWRIDNPPATHTELVGRFDNDAWPELITTA